MIEAAEVERLLRQRFSDALLELVDLTGTQDHYQARVVSSVFVGKSLIEQHQLVYGALGPAMNGAIHALALKTFTPEAWAKVSGGNDGRSLT
ncbi:MAG TPA: BolA family transcriptional regulator [Polyangiaceae bacterium]|jgi:stress-induced morphogen|nr:BolA family transcriptional regulator [Polyangiaceae bacterium]